MATRLQVCVPGSDLPRARPSGHSRRSSSIDSYRLLGAVRLEFFVTWHHFVLGDLDLLKGSTTATTTPGRLSLGTRARGIPNYHR